MADFEIIHLQPNQWQRYRAIRLESTARGDESRLLFAEQDGLRKARLKMNASQTPAVALYKQLGFQILAEENSVTGDGRTFLAYVMEKDIL
jgi:ribosomal protein S18 acetylase RimI-like enzyme